MVADESLTALGSVTSSKGRPPLFKQIKELDEAGNIRKSIRRKHRAKHYLR